MDEYVQLYGLNHWGDSYLSCSRHRIEDYIKPYIGDMFLCDLDKYYNELQNEPAVVTKVKKDTGKTISPKVIERIHTLLRSALNQAVTWGYIDANPVLNVELPKYRIHPVLCGQRRKPNAP